MFPVEPFDQNMLSVWSANSVPKINDQFPNFDDQILTPSYQTFLIPETRGARLPSCFCRSIQSDWKICAWVQFSDTKPRIRWKAIISQKEFYDHIFMSPGETLTVDRSEIWEGKKQTKKQITVRIGSFTRFTSIICLSIRCISKSFFVLMLFFFPVGDISRLLRNLGKCCLFWDGNQMEI